MRIRRFHSILDECLAALRQGESVDACLARYPRHAQRLRPLLSLAQRVSRTPPVSPRPWAESTAWEVVRRRAADLRQGRRRYRAPIAWVRPLAISLALVLAVMTAGGATVYAAQDSLPDSPLYRVKLGSEDAHLWFVFDDSSKADILLNQSQERTEEIMALIQQGKPLSGNVLTALKNRNQRAADILAGQPQDIELAARMAHQVESQEQLLLALWDDVSESARDDYAEAVATLHNTRLSTSGTFASIDPQDVSGGVLSISGLAEPATEGVWRIGGFEVRVDERTVGWRALEKGRTATVIAARGANGRLHALDLSAVDTGLPGPGTFVSGHVEQVTDDEIVIGSQRIKITAATLRKLKIQEGQRVEITVRSGVDGAVASSVESADTEGGAAAGSALSLEGAIESDVSLGDQANDWVIGGQTFAITGATVIDAQAGDVRSGARARVEALNEDGKWTAQRVTVLASDADPDAVNVTGVYQGARDGLWLVSGLAVQPADGATEPAPGSLVAIDAKRQATHLLGRTTTVLDAPGDGDVIRLQGLITNIQGDFWTVGFARVGVGKDAAVIGLPITGARALVWGRQGEDGTLEALHVRVLDQRSILSPGPQ